MTRSLPANLILDVRYVATRGVKLHSTLNYNEPDFRFNGLMEALKRRKEVMSTLCAFVPLR